MHLCEYCKFKEQCPVASNLRKRINRTEEVDTFFEDFEELPKTKTIVVECQSFINKTLDK